jgi:hypothetical protein
MYHSRNLRPFDFALLLQKARGNVFAARVSRELPWCMEAVITVIVRVEAVVVGVVHSDITTTIKAIGMDGTIDRTWL